MKPKIEDLEVQIGLVTDELELLLSTRDDHADAVNEQETALKEIHQRHQKLKNDYDGIMLPADSDLKGNWGWVIRTRICRVVRHKSYYNAYLQKDGAVFRPSK